MERGISLLEKNLWVKRNSLSSRGLLPSHLIFPPGYSNTTHGTKKMVNNGVIVDSSQWATQQRLNGGFHKHVSWSSQPGALGTDWERSKSYNHLNIRTTRTERKDREAVEETSLGFMISLFHFKKNHHRFLMNFISTKMVMLHKEPFIIASSLYLMVHTV